jgi:tagatose 6-phosphate kinase
VLKALGEKPFATGFLGGDRGISLKASLRVRKINHEFVMVSAPTRECITVIDQSSNEQTELVEESSPATSANYRKLFQLMSHRVKGCSAVIMSGTITPGGPIDFYKQCTAIAKRAGCLTVVDGKGPVLINALKARPDLVKPNRSEICATLGTKLESQSALMRAMRQFHDQGAQRIVVTAGSEPVLAFDGRAFWRVFSPRVRALNPIGSGDSFTAALVWRLVRGDELGEACRWGCAAGAANALSAMPGDLEFRDVERLARRVRVERL